MKGALFDLDGGIVDTAKYHFLAWRRLAAEMGFDLTQAENERLKGVSRMRSLEIVLELAGLTVDEEEKMALAEKKNRWYQEYIARMDETEILPGAREYLVRLRQAGVKTALASASKNAMTILAKTRLLPFFDAVVDGHEVTRAKPDPEVFLRAAAKLGLFPGDCVVFEDAEAGIEAARRAGMKAVGIGHKETLGKADLVVKGLDELL
ncbi:MAG: beta-phosphoglucomutase [Firmicutes bacterium]|nr:beta-phosphoglucomutase [Bacillota bacterium]